MSRDLLDAVDPNNGSGNFTSFRIKFAKFSLILARIHCPNLSVNDFGSSFILAVIYSQKSSGSLGDDDWR